MSATKVNTRFKRLHNVTYGGGPAIRIYRDTISGACFAFGEQKSNVVDVCLNYGKLKINLALQCSRFASATADVSRQTAYTAANLVLRAINATAANQFDFFAANAFSHDGISVDVGQVRLSVSIAR